MSESGLDAMLKQTPPPPPLKKLLGTPIGGIHSDVML